MAKLAVNTRTKFRSEVETGQLSAAQADELIELASSCFFDPNGPLDGDGVQRFLDHVNALLMRAASGGER